MVEKAALGVRNLDSPSSVKIYFAGLVASLALNAMLAGLLLRQPAANPSGEPPPTSSGLRSVRAGTPTHATIHRDPLWPASGPKEMDTLVERLQSAGCSPREICLILSSTIRHHELLRFLEYYRTSTYWSNPSPPSREKNTAGTARWLEDQQFTAKYLLTPELFAANDELLEQMRRQFGDLPVEKLRQIALIDNARSQTYIQLQLAQLRSSRPGESTFPDGAALRQNNEAREKAIRLALTPAEYEVYELHDSPTAYRLRSQLGPFRPTEAEYRALFAIEKAQSESAPSPNPTTPIARNALADEKKAHIVAALGPERAAEYAELQKNGAELPRLMARLDLPLTTISTIDRIRQDTSEAAAAVRENPKLSATERDAQLATLARKAETDLTTTLGGRGYAAYAELKGDWLRNLGPAKQSNSGSQ